VLWGERPPRSCRTLVHGLVGQLRGLLEPDRPRGSPGRTLVRAASGYRLTLDSGQLDLTTFDDLCQRAARAATEDGSNLARKLYGMALACWRGPLAHDHGPLRQHPAVVAATRQRLHAALAFADLGTAPGDHATTVAALLPLRAGEPLHEGLHARLILALAGSGEQAAALALYTELRNRLTDELGVEPGTELREAHRRVLRQEVTADPEPPVPVPAQLPPDGGAFTGRAEQLAWLDGLLAAAGDAPARRAVTIAVITGSAGVGKTALAVHWAHRVRTWFPDGQLYLNLRGYRGGRPVTVAEALARCLLALGVPAEKLPIDPDAAADLYRTLLADRRVLILVDDAAEVIQVRPLLPGGPGCTVVVTSRDRLAGLTTRDGGRALVLDTLPPDEAQLLLGRVIGADRTAREPAATAQLAALCAHLPLALRIAAADLAGRPSGTIAGYAARLAHGDRLTALEVPGDTDGTVRSAFDLSYAVLPAPAQRLFRLLGLMDLHDVTADVAAALTGTTPVVAGGLIARLAQAHLVTEHTDGRYTFHDLMRAYAAELTAARDSEPDRQAAVARLLAYYQAGVDAAARMLYPNMLRLAEPPADQAGPVPFGTTDGASAWLESERRNLVAAVEHGATHGPAAAAHQIADGLRGYFWLSLHAEDWRRVATASRDAAGDDLRVQTAAELSLACLEWRLGRHGPSLERHRAALEVARRADWLDGQACILGNLGAIHVEAGRPEPAIDYLHEALAINQRLGRLGGQTVNLGSIAILHEQHGRLETAAEYHHRALATCRRNGSGHVEAMILANLGEVAHRLGRFQEATAHLDQALVLHRSVRDRGAEADTLRCLAAAHRDAGHHEHALDLATAALDLAQQIGSDRILADALNTLGTIQDALGRCPQALESHQRAHAIARAANDNYPQTEALIGLATSHHRLGHHEAARTNAHEALVLARQARHLQQEGRALTAHAAISLSRNQPHDALSYARQALDIYRDTGDLAAQAPVRQLLAVIPGRAASA
jgi:tetratricopeptide (TPR) repeat protein/DNA-binding SARP family transcriptional activator